MLCTYFSYIVAVISEAKCYAFMRVFSYVGSLRAVKVIMRVLCWKPGSISVNKVSYPYI